MAVDVQQGQQHGGDGNGEEGTGHTEESRAEKDRAEGHGGVDVDGLGADLRLDREVLDLLVGHGPGQGDHPEPRIRAQQTDDYRQDDRDVGADGGDELGDDPCPQRQRQPVGHPDDDEHDARRDRIDRGEDHARTDIPAGLLRGQHPHGRDHLLRPGREESSDPTLEPWHVRRQVEHEQGEGEQPEHTAHHRAEEPDQADPQRGRCGGDLLRAQVDRLEDVVASTRTSRNCC